MSFYRNPADVGIMSRAGNAALLLDQSGGYLEPGSNAPRGILQEGILRPGVDGIYRYRKLDKSISYVDR